MKRSGFFISLMCGLLLACSTAQAQLEGPLGKSSEYNAIHQPARNGVQQ